MQPPLTVWQGCPCLLLQVPVASQVPAQRLATVSSWLVSVVQVPLLQVWQVAQSLSAQQFPVGMQAVPQAL